MTKPSWNRKERLSRAACTVQLISDKPARKETNIPLTAYTQSPIIKNDPIRNGAEILGKFKE